MAKDDYFVIVYKLLKYLYECIKKSKPVSMDVIDADYFGIEKLYWEYIITNLSMDGYITGVNLIPIQGKLDKGVKISSSIKITPKGILYLEENSVFNKVKEIVKDISDIIPL